MMNSKDLREAGVDEWLIEYRLARRRVGLTLPVLAEMTGFDITTIHRYETGGNVSGCPEASRKILEDALARWEHPRYRERIKAVCDRWDMSLATVACMSGVAPGTLDNICSGRTVLPRKKNREKLDVWLASWEKTVAANDTGKVAKAS